jgi:asparagine synthase (glutamine-hydrolysing)
MCGIVGYWNSRGPALANIVEQMASRIRHRGPDDAGIWVDDQNGLALAHRRLSIIDLSPAGHQPMISPCGRFALIFNGEIYNHGDLRKELDQVGGGFSWRGHSDTETLLAALRHWGVEGALQRLNGMFAFGLWDRNEQKLYLARDRMGEKPLYYGLCQGVFLFGSELKALRAYPNWHGKVDREALTLYLRHNYIPAPWSIYQGIHKLPPSHYVMIGGRGTGIGEPNCYWSLGDIAEDNRAARDAAAKPDVLIDELDDLLRDAVGSRMVADVPLGAFLSGGYDSTMVVAQMQAQSTRPVKTFSIGFNEEGYNEAHHAKAVAKHLGTEHTELYVTPEQAMGVIPSLSSIWDEPFSDSSQIPTFLVSELARRHVSVSLSGDGGDELFFGYERYFRGKRAGAMIDRVPRSIQVALAWLLRSLPPGPMDTFGRHLPGSLKKNALGDRLNKLADVLSGLDSRSFYHRLVSHWKEPDKIVLGTEEPQTLFSLGGQGPRLSCFSELMMYLDTLTYLPDDILTKVDRASMAVSLEARVPLLDHRLVEFAWRVPLSMKYRDGEGKWLLRQVLYRYVPRELMDRPKMGFGVPIEQWIRGPLRDWAEELLDERRLLEEGFFDPLPIRHMWQEHLTGKRRWHYYLWDILMFQAWLDEQ